MGAHVEARHPRGDAARDGGDFRWVDDAVDESDLDGVLGRERLGEDRGPGEGRRRQPLPEDLECCPRHGEPDGHLVRRELVRARCADSIVAGQQQERAHCHGVPGACDRNGQRERQQSFRQLEAGADHRDRTVAAGAQYRKVEPGREDPGAAAEHDDRVVGLGAIERCTDLVEHARRQRVDLAIVHGDGGDRVVELIADKCGHGTHLGCRSCDRG